MTGVTRLLLGTRNSALLRQGKLDMDYAFVSADAAHYLVDMGIKLVGIDYLPLKLKDADGAPVRAFLREL